jgi:mRNA-degrading endonuclease RelE of RelBE toxin-antitoxin system
MKYRVELRAPVKGFIDTLAPDSRKKLRSGLLRRETEKGDYVALRERLAGFHRLRIGRYRVLYRYLPGR